MPPGLGIDVGPPVGASADLRDPRRRTPRARSNQGGASPSVSGLGAKHRLELMHRVREQPHLGVGDTEVEVRSDIGLGNLRGDAGFELREDRPWVEVAVTVVVAHPRILAGGARTKA